MDHTKERAAGTCTPRRRRRCRRAHGFIRILQLGIFFAVVCLAVCGAKVHEEPMSALEPAKQPEKQAAEPIQPERSSVSPDDWQVLLVNRWTPIPDGYAFERTTLRNGQSVDSRADPDLQEMMDACRAAGLNPRICSSYRTWEKQRELYTNKIQRLLDEGMPYEDAVGEAGTVVAVPGTSEHQTGLALDIVDTSYQILDEAQEDTDVQRWLAEHSWEYGFVLRYPPGKSEITGIIYEPWHYRYVGRTAAREMTELGLCLEEYVDWLSSR